jgi:hypothetical protein
LAGGRLDRFCRHQEQDRQQNSAVRGELHIGDRVLNERGCLAMINRESATETPKKTEVTKSENDHFTSVGSAKISSRHCPSARKAKLPL